MKINKDYLKGTLNNKYKQSAIYLVVLLCFATFLEGVVFNLDYFKLDHEQKGLTQLEFSDLQLNNIQYDDNKLKVIGNNPYLQIDKNIYIKNLIIKASKDNNNFKISVDNGKVTDMRQYGIDAKLKDTSSIKINNEASKTKIYIAPHDGEDSIEIENISVLNEYKFNIYRFMVIIAIGVVGGYVLIFGGFVKEKLHISFLVIILTLGVTVSILTPTYFSYDERQHFIKSYQLSRLDFGMRDGKEIKWPDKMTEFFASDGIVDAYDSYDERIKYNNEFSMTNYGNKAYFGTTASTYLFIPYIPAAIGIALGRMMHLPFIDVYHLGRIFSLLAYAFICYLVIKKIKIAKRLVFFICLLPAVVYGAGAYSADGMTLAFSMAAIGIFVNLIVGKNKIDLYKVAAFVVCISLAIMSKVSYAPLCLVFLAIPMKKFETKKQGILTKLGVLVVSFITTLITYQFALSKNIEQWPIPGVSSSGQIHFIINNLFQYVQVVVKLFADNVYSYFNGVSCSLAYSGNLQNIFTVLIIVVLFLMAICDDECDVYNMSIADRIFLALSVALSWGMVVSALYVTFTPVGSTTVNGVQGRYMTPLVLPALLILKNRFVKMNVKKERLNLIMIASVVFLLVITSIKLLNQYSI